MSDPQTPDEWQEAADAADFLLFIDSAQQYGLIEGGDHSALGDCRATLDTLRRMAE